MRAARPKKKQENTIHGTVLDCAYSKVSTYSYFGRIVGGESQPPPSGFWFGPTSQTGFGGFAMTSKTLVN